MSGLITGPEFQAFFQKPDSVELGTMVAVLEIGAFSAPLPPIDNPGRANGLRTFSYFACCWSCRRHDWTAYDAVLWRPRIHYWWRNTDIYDRLWYHGLRESRQRLWSGLAFVSLYAGHMCLQL